MSDEYQFDVFKACNTLGLEKKERCDVCPVNHFGLCTTYVAVNVMPLWFWTFETLREVQQSASRFKQTVHSPV